VSAAAPPPDWAALYAAHRDAMHRVAKTVLRGTGLLDQAEDAVQDAMRSLMASPPRSVQKWEAVMVSAAKNKAIDLLRSAYFRHAGPEVMDQHFPTQTYSNLAEDVSEAIDRQRAAAIALNLLKLLPERERDVVWRREALEVPREQIAAELGVSPGRVSQITKAALQQLHDLIEKGER